MLAAAVRLVCLFVAQTQVQRPKVVFGFVEFDLTCVTLVLRHVQEFGCNEHKPLQHHLLTGYLQCESR